MIATFVILAITVAAGLLFGAAGACGAFLLGCLCLLIWELRRAPVYDDDEEEND